MGTFFSASRTKLQYTSIQTSVNNYLSVADNTCITWSDASASNNKVNIIGSTTGDITISATGQADMTCVINQAIQMSINNQFVALSKQYAKVPPESASLFNSFQFSSNVQTTKQVQTMINNSTQITQNTCGSSSQSVANNNFVNVVASDTGDIAINADSVSSSSCMLTNLILQEGYNTSVAVGDQGIDTAKDSILKTLFGLIILIIVFIVIVVVVIIIISVVAKKMKKPPPAPPLTEEEAFMKELENLGPTPEGAPAAAKVD